MRIPFLNHNSVIANVSLAKQKVHPVTLELRQEYGDHHHFDMTLDYDMYGDDFLSNPVKHIELIGRLVFIRFKHQESSTEGYQFKGVVTSVRQTGREGKKGYLVVSGSSPTIMLEKGNRLDIYSNQSLYQITKQITERAYSDYISFGSEPVYKNKIEFLMQYNESDWDFLKRIAYLYRENLYYSGHELLFGSFDDLETVALTYDREIIDLEFCSKLLATNFERYQYVSQNDTTIERELPKQIDNSNDFVDSAEEMSYNAMNVQEHSKTYMDAPVYTNSEVSDLLKREKSRNAAQTITIKGKSKTYKTTLGRVIHISIPQELSATSTIGNYRVIKSIHRIDENNRYSCEFEAVPASLDSIPANQPKAQYADSVVARVKSNEDPLNQGRVQVDFQFASNYNYSWLRVLTPNAGSSTQVSQNRGMVFVPEKGDQVMIGFEYGDPNRPYVMGSLFHGKNGKGGGQNNAEKSIITKSGVQIVFNDNQRSLHIQDPSGNTWDMDGQGNIKVFAPKKIKMDATDIELSAKNNMIFNAGNNLLMSITNKLNATAAYMKSVASDTMQMFSNRSLFSSREKMQMQSDEINALGMNKLFLHSDQLIHANSKGTMDWKSTGAMNLAQDAQDAKRDLEVVSKAVVLFRPKVETKLDKRRYYAFDGGYGLDWMRIGGLIGSVPDIDYKNYLRESLDDTGKHYTNAYEGIILRYDPLKMEHNQNEMYCTTFLNLYPQNAPEWEGNPIQPAKEAKLMMGIDYKEKGVYKIELKPQFGAEKLINIKNNIAELNADKTIDDDFKELTDITISMQEGAVLDKDVYINAWAYTQPDDKNKDATNEPSLAGRIKVMRNDTEARRKIKVLIVPLKIDVFSTGSAKEVDDEQREELIKQKNYMQKWYAQALVYADVEFMMEDYDLSKDSNFNVGGRFIYNFNLEPNISEDEKENRNIGGIYPATPMFAFKKEDWDESKTKEENMQKGREIENKNYGVESAMLAYLEDKFREDNQKMLELGEWEDYSSHVLIFVFPTQGCMKNEKTLQGFSRGIGKRSVVLFNDKMYPNTMAHECLHSLGLLHTFRNFIFADLPPNQKLIFGESVIDIKKALSDTVTDNIMSYNASANYLWQWQTDILRSSTDKLD